MEGTTGTQMTCVGHALTPKMSRFSNTVQQAQQSHGLHSTPRTLHLQPTLPLPPTISKVLNVLQQLIEGREVHVQKRVNNRRLKVYKRVQNSNKTLTHILIQYVHMSVYMRTCTIQQLGVTYVHTCMNVTMYMYSQFTQTV